MIKRNTYRTLMIVVLFLIALTGCNKKTINDKPVAATSQNVVELNYNRNVNLEQINTFTQVVVHYVSELGSACEQMSNLCQKYADEINYAKSFEWSSHWDFRELKTNVDALCNTILDLDESGYSYEMQLCVKEIKAVAYNIQLGFEYMEEETDPDNLSVIINHVVDAVTIRLKNATVYDTMANISYMQENDGDKDTVAKMIVDIEKETLYQKGNYNNIFYSASQNKYEDYFANEQGKFNTKCVVANCEEAITPFGDSCYCIIHSSRCLNCGTYIDADSVYCKDCISNIEISNMLPTTCRFQYLDGTFCENKVNLFPTLCDTHVEKLLNLYLALIELYK